MSAAAGLFVPSAQGGAARDTSIWRRRVLGAALLAEVRGEELVEASSHGDGAVVQIRRGCREAAAEIWGGGTGQRP